MHEDHLARASLPLESRTGTKYEFVLMQVSSPTAHIHTSCNAVQLQRWLEKGQDPEAQVWREAASRRRGLAV